MRRPGRFFRDSMDKNFYFCEGKKCDEYENRR